MTRSTMALKLWLSPKGCGWEDRANLEGELKASETRVRMRVNGAGYKAGEVMTSEGYRQCFADRAEIGGVFLLVIPVARLL